MWQWLSRIWLAESLRFRRLMCKSAQWTAGLWEKWMLCPVHRVIYQTKLNLTCKLLSILELSHLNSSKKVEIILIMILYSQLHCILLLNTLEWIYIFYVGSWCLCFFVTGLIIYKSVNPLLLKNWEEVKICCQLSSHALTQQKHEDPKTVSNQIVRI